MSASMEHEHGYASTPLEKKLGIKTGMAALFVDLPKSLATLAQTDGLSRCDTALPSAPTARAFDYIHVFDVSRDSLANRLPLLRALLCTDGMLWISWPKKASKVPTSISEDVLRELVLPTGLVDVKVCAIDATWSALKFVFRKEMRGKIG